MRLKSYFVHSMDEAIQLAKRELGEDAMLVDSKPLAAPPTSRARLEVIFAASSMTPSTAVARLQPGAVEQTHIPEVEPAVAPPAPAVTIGLAPIPPPALLPQFNEQRLAEFRTSLGALLCKLEQDPRQQKIGGASPWKPLVESLYGVLLERDVPAPQAFDLLESLQNRLASDASLLEISDSELRKHARGLLEDAIGGAVQTRSTASGVSPRVILLAGPAGAGKTTNIVKLAFQLGVAQSKPVQVLSLDTLRIGASAQMGHLCSLIGVPFRPLESAAGLASALAENRHRDTVLIDTPGFAYADSEALLDLSAVLANLPEVERHLVVPAWLRYSDLLRVRSRYTDLRPTHLLVTRLDETDMLGPAWALAADSGLPFSWFSTGPNIPDDLEPANSARLASCLAGKTAYLLPAPPPKTTTHTQASRAAAGGRFPA